MGRVDTSGNPRYTKDTLAKPFGSTIRELREKRGLGLKRAAPEIGVSYSYLSKLENGLVGPSDDTIEALAAYYDVDVDYLGVMAGRLPPDILAILQNDPEGALRYLRERFG
jgi:transcriptional regulator with XRE-family HTH domain